MSCFVQEQSVKRIVMAMIGFIKVTAQRLGIYAGRVFKAVSAETKAE